MIAFKLKLRRIKDRKLLWYDCRKMTVNIKLIYQILVSSEGNRENFFKNIKNIN